MFKTPSSPAPRGSTAHSAKRSVSCGARFTISLSSLSTFFLTSVLTSVLTFFLTCVLALTLILPLPANAQATRPQVERLAASIAANAAVFGKGLGQGSSESLDQARGQNLTASDERLARDLSAFNQATGAAASSDWPSAARWALVCGLARTSAQTPIQAAALKQELLTLSCDQWLKHRQLHPQISSEKSAPEPRPKLNMLLEHTRHGVPVNVLETLYQAGLKHVTVPDVAPSAVISNAVVSNAIASNTVASNTAPNALSSVAYPPALTAASPATLAQLPAVGETVKAAPTQAWHTHLWAGANLFETLLNIAQIAVFAYMVYWGIVWLWGAKRKRRRKHRSNHTAGTQNGSILSAQGAVNSHAFVSAFANDVNSPTPNTLPPISEAQLHLNKQLSTLQRWIGTLTAARDSVLAFNDCHVHALSKISEERTALAGHKICLIHYANAIEQALKIALAQHSHLSADALGSMPSSMLSATPASTPSTTDTSSSASHFDTAPHDAAVILGQLVSSCIDIQVWLTTHDKQHTALGHWAQFVWQAVTQLHFHATLASERSNGPPAALPVPTADFEDEAAPTTVSSPPSPAAIDRLMNEALKPAILQ